MIEEGVAPIETAGNIEDEDATSKVLEEGGG